MSEVRRISPQAIGQAMETLPTRRSCAAVKSVSQNASLVKKREKWGCTTTQLLTRFNPDVQRFCAANIDRCFTGDAPTLIEVRKAYSPETVDSWLDAQLTNLIVFCGVKGKDEFSASAIVNALTAVIADNFGYLKLSELMLFFQQFKAGRYGRFYGSVDPMVITEALQSFLYFRAERIAAIDKAQRQEEELKREAKRAEQERNCELLTAEEWKEISWLYNM